MVLSNMSGGSADEFDLSPRFGPVVGGAIVYPVHDAFELQAELIFSIKGLKRTYEIPAPEGPIHFDETASLYYLELPLLARFPFPLPRSPIIATYGGISAGILLSGSANGKYTPQSGEMFSDGAYDMGIANYRRFDFSVVLGGDIQFPLGHTIGFIDLRYVYGLVDIFHDVDAPVGLSGDEFPFADFITGEGNDLRNGAFMITFGIKPSL